MSDEPVPFGKPCELHSKTGYKTRQQALDALAYLRDRATTDTIPRRAYHAPVCRMWHLTSKKR